MTRWYHSIGSYFFHYYLKSDIERGVINNWDDMKKIESNTFFNELCVASEAPSTTCGLPNLSTRVVPQVDDNSKSCFDFFLYISIVLHTSVSLLERVCQSKQHKES